MKKMLSVLMLLVLEAAAQICIDRSGCMECRERIDPFRGNASMHPLQVDL